MILMVKKIWQEFFRGTKSKIYYIYLVHIRNQLFLALELSLQI